MKKILSFLYDNGQTFFFFFVFMYAMCILVFLRDISTSLILMLLLFIISALGEVQYMILEGMKSKKIIKKKKNNTPKK